MIDRMPQIAGETPVPTLRVTYAHPREIVADPSLSDAQKRGLLSDWARDARADPHTAEALIGEIEAALSELGPPSDA